MKVKNVSTQAAIMPQLKALQETDLSTMIRLADMLAPKAVAAFLLSLNSKQKSAIDKVMPAGGEKQLYIQLIGTPTPPIVISLAQPLKMVTMTEKVVQDRQIKGIRLAINDLQLLAGGITKGNILKLVWRLKGQLPALMSIYNLFTPLIKLGPSELKDMGEKLKIHFKPVIDLLPKKI